MREKRGRSRWIKIAIQSNQTCNGLWGAEANEGYSSKITTILVSRSFLTMDIYNALTLYPEAINMGYGRGYGVYFTAIFWMDTCITTYLTKWDLIKSALSSNLASRVVLRYWAHTEVSITTGESAFSTNKHNHQLSSTIIYFFKYFWKNIIFLQYFQLKHYSHWTRMAA